MSVKTILPAALVLALLGLCPARGQTPSNAAANTNSNINNQANNTDAADDLNGHTHAQAEEGPHTLSHYITYQRADCCGPVGSDGPIQMELYARAGASFLLGNTAFAQALQTGWTIEGGGRSLFYDPSMDAAWTVDLGLSNTWNHGKLPLSFALNNVSLPFQPAATDVAPAGTVLANFAHVNFIPGNPTVTRTGPFPAPPATTGGTTQAFFIYNAPGVTLHNYNRTFVNLALGREWYLKGTALDCGPKWRVGVDVGGRWGTSRLELNEIRHRTAVCEGLFVSAHTDVEYPCCSVVFLFGLRAEWSYTFCDQILQEINDTNLQEINIMLTTGVRF
jgi:hypothetical protein